MKTLITGANGQLGWELQRTSPDDWRLIALNHAELDITDSTAVAAAFQKHQPDLVINTAAYTAVDKAENEKDKAYAVNMQGAANIVKAAKNSGARLIHISTDFIFDGRKSQPYLTGDKPNPINAYGASKLQGEEAVLHETKNRALILRTGWVYSSHGSNFVKTMLNLLAQREEISVVADQIGTPTWARSLARAIYNFADMPEAQGIYHWTDAGIASWYDFAVAIQDEAHRLGILQGLIPVIPIRTEDYPTAAKRPPYSVLDKTAAWQTLGYTASYWRVSLRRMLEEVKEKGLRTEV
jgi:dTDP-4-dehydrorhamnose reductase